MMHPIDPPTGSKIDTLMGTIYYLSDCLADLAACLLPLDGPTDPDIDYAQLAVDYAVASATIIRTMRLLTTLIEQSLES